MKGFIVYSTYRVIDGRPYVCLFGRLENGESFLTMNYCRPYFYIKYRDLKKALNLENFEHAKTENKDFNGKPVAKIFAELPRDIQRIRKSFEEAGIACYEADIRFATRFLIDKGIKGCMEIDGSYTTEGSIDRIYKEPELEGTRYNPKLKIMSLDIETDADETKVISAALVQDELKKVFILSDKNLKNAVSCSSESELLERLRDAILEHDPDIITGWNLIDFDLAFLQKRFKEQNIQFILGRTNEPCRLKIRDSYIIDSKADIPGRVALDGLSLLRNSFIKLQDYKLNTAAKQILGDSKLSIKWEDVDVQKLAEYNLKDAELVIKILEKSRVVELAIKKSMLTGLQLDSVSASIASLDSLYIREAAKRCLVVPSRDFREKEERIKGGYVMEPVPGIYSYVLVLDFLSLYPSIIRTFNIDPASHVSTHRAKNIVRAPNNACFRNEEGILPSVIEKLWKERDKAKEMKDELSSYAIKILMNSFFGSLASPACRFFNLDIANAITHFGQFIIKMTTDRIKDMGFNVLYTDTDSVFVFSNAKSHGEAESIGKRIEQDINLFYEGYVKEMYGRKSWLKLEFKKCFTRFLMQRIRKGQAGAKKRYAGMLDNGRIEFTGLEFIRSDWTELSKRFQVELLERVFRNKGVRQYIKRFLKDLMDGRFDSLLVYRKAVRKNLDSYEVKAQHVKAALKLGGITPGIIEYVMTTDGPEPLQNLRHSIDYEHYINKQLRPVADSILCFLGESLEGIMKGKQKTLSGF